MASLSSLLYSCAFILLLNFMTCPCSQVNGVEEANHHVVNVQALFPKNVCTPSKESDPSKLQVVDRHGPCSPMKPRHKPTHKQILDHDQTRVDWLHRKSSSSAAAAASSDRSVSGQRRPKPSLVTSDIPVQSGGSLGTGNYVVTVAFGTPSVTQSVVFDTGSDVTWIQCQPCAATCYQQQDPLFDPAKSSTYRNISCISPFCSSLDSNGCSGSTCLYAVQYGDNSYTVGFFAQDTLNLADAGLISDFRFGCGQNNKGLFGQTAGILGLGREPVSVVMQAADKFGGVFSYCLPSRASSTGYLKFGGVSASNVQFTPLLSQSSNPTFYFVELVGISVGGQMLAISPTLFSSAGTLLDSGTVITRLPPTAYSALKSAFRQAMTQYPTAPAASILDTCYDFRNYTTITIPSVVFQYRGVMTSLDPTGILYPVTASQTCLAFAPNGADSDLVIIGNTQQRTFNVVYDVMKKQIGFGPGGC